MNTFEKILNVIKNNVMATIILVVALILFFAHLGDLLPAIIIVASALIGYICGTILYREYIAIKAPVKATVKPVVKTVAKPVAKPAAKRAPAKKKK